MTDHLSKVFLFDLNLKWYARSITCVWLETWINVIYTFNPQEHHSCQYMGFFTELTLFLVKILTVPKKRQNSKLVQPYKIAKP